MKTEKSIQFLSNNRKLIAGPCKKQFFLSFYLFYYIHTPVPPLSQANQSDGNRVAREVGFDHHLTTSSPQPVPLIVCTLQHSFITTTNNAESCAHYTISGAVSWHLPARHSSPTTVTGWHGLPIFGDASFENPASRQFSRWSDHELTTMYVSPQSFTKFHTMNLVPATIFIHVRL